MKPEILFKVFDSSSLDLADANRLLAQINISNPALLIPAVCGAASLMLFSLNYLSYNVLKRRIIGRGKWDLNICCGKTDGGGVNADIIKHVELPNFRKVDDVYELPFEDNSFDTVLSSHTMEHLEHPQKFYKELKRVGKDVTLVIPPLWDLSAVMNIFEHRKIFLSFSKEHKKLPKFINLPFSEFYQRRYGQKIKA